MNRLALMLGCRQAWVNGEPGTGLTRDAGGDASFKATYIDRITGDAAIVPAAPDVVFIEGSTNDDVATATVIQAALTAAITQVRNQWPGAFLVVSGVLHPTTAGTGDTTNNTALRGIATAAPSSGGADLFIDAIADGWYSGTGTTAAPTGSGNSDVYLSSDGIHPAQAGHDFIGEMLASYIGAALAA